MDADPSLLQRPHRLDPAPARPGPVVRHHAGVAEVVPIYDPQDPRLADYRALTDVELRKRVEPAHGIFIAESALVIQRALAAGYRMISAFVSDRWLDELADQLSSVEAPVYVGAPEVLQSVTGFHVHRGALAAFARRPLSSVEEILRTSRRIVVLEDVNNHTNLGAVFRCAAALGMDGVLLSPRCADPLYRRSVRVSMGAVFAIPYARFDTWPDELTGVSAAQFRLLALTPDPAATDIRTLRVAAGERIALMLGAEGPGLSKQALDRAELRVRIPMHAGVDSLNVAAAAAIACFVVGEPAPPRLD
ncbi:tRNA/rRNA methyltransferase (SpoU) [Acidothermus cellulolyticus 11B]|uniref:tRNA/rRNA methyltransferase (SpoU) n=1 Tax=Acidothermus cellulolyticus (strain ATCC 43068 / DSM 8971 / 11B) TaxID=351607 RepID=A0LU22_ACIC1|nr:tRNA/rRNA methyltransferase (SpoU) [Acidothermus cellulolyticus 11B]